MWELYWLTRVQFIGVAAGIVLFVSVICSISLLLNWMSGGELSDKAKSVKKFACIAGTISLMILILTPTKKDLLLIYGLGPTADYIQDNDKIKELPDKCVEALSKWVDSLNEDK